MDILKPSGVPYEKVSLEGADTKPLRGFLNLSEVLCILPHRYKKFTEKN